MISQVHIPVKANKYYLLVRLVRAFWVTDLGKKVILPLEDKVLNMVRQLSQKWTKKIISTRMPLRYANWVSSGLSELSHASY
jgi:hypothetical protein